MSKLSAILAAACKAFDAFCLIVCVCHVTDSAVLIESWGILFQITPGLNKLSISVSCGGKKCFRLCPSKGVVFRLLVSS